jgi:hypothetical protein
MDTADIWYAALGILADLRPLAYWEMSNGASFWWILTDRSQLLADRFAEQPFTYSEIVSILVILEGTFGQSRVSCDWPSIKNGLLAIPGLGVVEVRDAQMAEVAVPNRALRLTVPV